MQSIQWPLAIKDEQIADKNTPQHIVLCCQSCPRHAIFSHPFIILHKKRVQFAFPGIKQNINGVDFSLIYWVPIGGQVCTLGLNRDPVFTPSSYPPTPDVETLSIFHLDPFLIMAMLATDVRPISVFMEMATAWRSLGQK